MLGHGLSVVGMKLEVALLLLGRSRPCSHRDRAGPRRLPRVRVRSAVPGARLPSAVAGVRTGGRALRPALRRHHLPHRQGAPGRPAATAGRRRLGRPGRRHQRAAAQRGHRVPHQTPRR
ncbi:hypothetical protein ACFQ0M_00050 [Kitasatospora aburaviensis]